MNDTLADREGEWSVYIKDLDNDSSLLINDRTVYPDGEIKLFAMGAAYQAIYDGTYHEDVLYDDIENMVVNSNNDAFSNIAGR